jgi:hypothetical protein
VPKPDYIPTSSAKKRRISIICIINLGKVPQEETAIEPGEDFSQNLIPGRIVRPGTFAEREWLNLALVSPGVFLPAGNI